MTIPFAVSVREDLPSLRLPPAVFELLSRRRVTPIRTADISAPAKINLTLRIVGRRPDGYHELVSWVGLIGLCDRLRFSFESGGIFFRCDDRAVPSDESNLVVRAANAMRAAGVDCGASIQLKKHIPIAAGLGGGSSDAAATLLGLNELWALGWSVERLAEIGSTIGSDIPVFVSRRQSVMRGRGEIVSPLARGWDGWVVLVVPPFGVSTREVYGELRAGDYSGTRPEPESLVGLSADELSGRLFNDLEPAAFRIAPKLGHLRAFLSEETGRCVRMSGSGSTLFAIFDERGQAEEWQRRVESTARGEFRTVLCSTWHEATSSKGASIDGNHRGTRSAC